MLGRSGQLEFDIHGRVHHADTEQLQTASATRLVNAPAKYKFIVYVESNAVKMRSNLSRYYTRHCDNSGRK